MPIWVLDKLSDGDQDNLKLVPINDAVHERKDLCCFLTNGNEERVDRIIPELCGKYHEYASEQSEDYFLKIIIDILQRRLVLYSEGSGFK